MRKFGFGATTFIILVGCVEWTIGFVSDSAGLKSQGINACGVGVLLLAAYGFLTNLHLGSGEQPVEDTSIYR
jgi:hypothetical protein